MSQPNPHIMNKLIPLISLLIFTACTAGQAPSLEEKIPDTVEPSSEEQEDKKEVEAVFTPRSELPSETEFKLVSGNPPYADPDPIFYEGQVELEGKVEDIDYFGSTVQQFVVSESSLEKIPEHIRGREFRLASYVRGQEEKKAELLSLDVLEELRDKSKESPISIRVDSLRIYMEGSPIMNVVSY